MGQLKKQAFLRRGWSEDPFVKPLLEKKKNGRLRYLGPGDDASVHAPHSGRLQVVTTDAMVEGTHWEPEWANPSALAEKLVGSNLSDLSAMGAQAEHAWLTLALPIAYSQTQANRLRHALQDCLDRCAIRLAGGDTVAVSGPLFMSMTLQGSADPKRILRRSSARPGDAILVSGALGSAHAGLYAWRQRDRLGPWPGWERLRKRFWAPPDRTVLGRALGRHAARYACMDLSDGLAKDLRRLCAASGVGARIFAELLPMDQDLKPAAVIAKADPRHWSLSGGEDYELLFTCPPDQVAHWVDQYACTWIGEILARARTVVDWGKGVERLLRGGWEHGREQK